MALELYQRFRVGEGVHVTRGSEKELVTLDFIVARIEASTPQVQLEVRQRGSTKYYVVNDEVQRIEGVRIRVKRVRRSEGRTSAYISYSVPSDWTIHRERYSSP